MKIPQAFKDSTEIRSYAAGSLIFENGQQGSEMFVVEEGEVDLVLGEKILETVVADGFFGEMSLIDHEPRSATAIARTDCKLLILNQHRFNFYVDEIPFFAIHVMKKMAERLRRASRMEK
jgi:CRP/FNR family transcriptional regulator, cyclic AMP receptor protein